MTSDALPRPTDDDELPQVPLTDELVLDLLDDGREVAGVLGGAYPVVPRSLLQRA